jgi:octaprenyl-diphosphate synthase
MKQFGNYAGLAFQIKDDMFDYQSKGIIGKPIANDIREKKFTLPLILALKKADPKEAKKIIRMVGQNTKTTATVNEIIQFVLKNDGLTESDKYLNDFKNRALTILKEFPENDARKSLEALVEYVISRKK